MPSDPLYVRLSSAQAAFDFSLGAYALLTSDEYGDLVTQYRVRLWDDGELEVYRTGQERPQGPGYSRVTVFNRRMPREVALEVVHAAYSQMIVECYDATKAFAKAKGRHEWDVLKRQPWFAFAGHLRNAFAHDGLFVFNDSSIFPATFRRFLIEPKVQGQPVKGFLRWLHGQQLCAQMTLYVEGRVDAAQERTRKMVDGDKGVD